VGDYLNAAIGDIPGLQAEVWVHRADADRAKQILEVNRVSSDSGVESEEEE
jgi:hypothetical protein